MTRPLLVRGCANQSGALESFERACELGSTLTR